MIIQGISYPSEFEAKKQSSALAAALAAAGCSVAGTGSISIRTGPNAVWFTGRGADWCLLKPDSFIRTDLNGRQSMGMSEKPLPEETAVHLKVYAENPKLRCVIHAHPAGICIMGSKGIGAEPADFSPVVKQLGRVAFKAFSSYEALAAEAGAAALSDKGIIAGSDGCFMWGESVQEAGAGLKALIYYEEALRIAAQYGAAGGAWFNCGNCPCKKNGARKCDAPACPLQYGEKPKEAAAGHCSLREKTYDEPLMEGVTAVVRPGGEALPEPVTPKTSLDMAAFPPAGGPSVNSSGVAVRTSDLVKDAPMETVMEEVIASAVAAFGH